MITRLRVAFLAIAGILVMAGWPAVSLTSQGTRTPLQIPDMAGRIMTVNGPIDPAQLGHTIMHEHVFIDFRVPNETAERWRLAGRTMQRVFSRAPRRAKQRSKTRC